MQAACKTLHLAFERLSADEVYNILSGILMRVIKAYDPGYTQKIKLVAEAIDRRASIDDVITGDELELPFEPRRYLRWLARNGNLEQAGARSSASVRASGRRLRTCLIPRRSALLTTSRNGSGAAFRPTSPRA